MLPIFLAALILNSTVKFMFCGVLPISSWPPKCDTVSQYITFNLLTSVDLSVFR